MKACFSHQNVPTGWIEHPDLVDHRYFYWRDNDIGGYTCGLIRDAIAEQLLMWEVNFADTNFLASLPAFITNPSVTGFMIESAVLSSIRSHGLAIGADIQRPMRIILFRRSFNIAMDITGEPVLYLPQKFNHESIDGIIVFIESNKPKKKKHPKKYARKAKKNAKEDDKEECEEDKKQKRKLFMFPLQITLALETHKDSHAKFFEEYNKWAAELSIFDVEVQFLWITQERCEIRQHRSCSKWPGHIERYIPLKHVSDAIWRKYQAAKGLT